MRKHAAVADINRSTRKHRQNRKQERRAGSTRCALTDASRALTQDTFECPHELGIESQGQPRPCNVDTETAFERPSAYGLRTIRLLIAPVSQADATPSADAKSMRDAKTRALCLASVASH
jgi:hypothetical protein